MLEFLRSKERVTPEVFASRLKVALTEYVPVMAGLLDEPNTQWPDMRIAGPIRERALLNGIEMLAAITIATLTRSLDPAICDAVLHHAGVSSTTGIQGYFDVQKLSEIEPIPAGVSQKTPQAQLTKAVLWQYMNAALKDVCFSAKPGIQGYLDVLKLNESKPIPPNTSQEIVEAFLISKVLAQKIGVPEDTRMAMTLSTWSHQAANAMQTRVQNELKRVKIKS